MENMNIMDHPPWYARGTPLEKTRDGPAMALSDKSFLAISRKPSASGANPKDRNRVNPEKEIRRWLTLKILFFQHTK